ncbi:MAG: hypothetical protein CMN30_14635 [Sandaracinus sp.]|nr:hypothetical protein [Sandaracinus sp.]
MTDPTLDIPIDFDPLPEALEDSGVIDLSALLAERRAQEARGEAVALAPTPLALGAAPGRRPVPFWAWAASTTVFALSALVFAATPQRVPPTVAPTAKAQFTAGGEAPLPAAAPVPILAAAAEPTPVATVVPERDAAPAPRTSVPSRSRRAAPVETERVAPARSWDTGDVDGAEALDPTIDDLLDRALGSASSDPRLTTSALPETPTRHQVSTTLRALEGEVRLCAESGVARVRLTVDGSTGRVSGVSVGGLAGAEAACVASAVRSARFPHFERERFVIDYPYVL